jgi:hypothetical protein
VENAATDEAGQSMFRAMKMEADGLPKLGRSGRELGVRIDGPVRDLAVGLDGTVEPAIGRMSVALMRLATCQSRDVPDHSVEKAEILCSR